MINIASEQVESEEASIPVVYSVFTENYKPLLHRPEEIWAHYETR